MKIMTCALHPRARACQYCRMSVNFAAKIAAKTFVVTGELTPPKGTDLTKLFAAADLLRGSVDALNITESPRARMAMDPRAVGKLLQDRGIEVIVQVTSRDRNRIARDLARSIAHRHGVVTGVVLRRLGYDQSLADLVGQQFTIAAPFELHRERAFRSDLQL